MSIFLIIVGILGVLVSLHSLYDGARYLAALWRGPFATKNIAPSTVWVETTAPALATILLFLLQHWVFSIVILFKIIALVWSGLTKGAVSDRRGALFHYGFGFADGILLVFGPATILALSLTGEGTLWSWYFPALVVACFFGEWIANIIFSAVIGALSAMIAR